MSQDILKLSMRRKASKMKTRIELKNDLRQIIVEALDKTKTLTWNPQIASLAEWQWGKLNNIRLLLGPFQDEQK